jgi:hypothetical protein
MGVKNGQKKAKGRDLSRDGAPCYPYFRRSGSAYQITTALPGIAGRFELSPSFPHPPVVTVVVRATSLPIASLVADSLVGHSVSLSFWKISLPLISKTPGRSRELSAFACAFVEKESGPDYRADMLRAGAAATTNPVGSGLAPLLSHVPEGVRVRGARPTPSL